MRIFRMFEDTISLGAAHIECYYNFTGPENYPDIDYTSEDSFLVHWHGFIDHESGIKLYRIGLANKCLNSNELYHMNVSQSGVVFKEVLYPENTVQLPALFTGQYYVTVIAVNHAMEPSDPVCSDGIIRDETPPQIHNVTIVSARWSGSIYCHDNITWFLRFDLVKVPITHNQNCTYVCGLQYSSAFVESIPNDLENTTNLYTTKPLDLICSDLPKYDPTNIIYLPNDRIFIRWDFLEDNSQIYDFFVGFGQTITEINNPDLVKYVSTDKKRFFESKHIGIGSDEEFYIFLKAVNKAHLETIIPIGPLLIDQTPPLYRRLPEVTIDDDVIKVGWADDTFYDDEQPLGINRIVYQISMHMLYTLINLQRIYSLDC